MASAAVDEALERLERIELAEVIGQASGCRLADHLKQGSIKSCLFNVGVGLFVITCNSTYTIPPSFMFPIIIYDCKIDQL